MNEYCLKLKKYLHQKILLLIITEIVKTVLKFISLMLLKYQINQIEKSYFMKFLFGTLRGILTIKFLMKTEIF